MVLLSYDVSAEHKKVKETLKAAPYNYHETAKVGETVCKLPNTTLWKPEGTSDQAIKDITKVAAGLKVTLEKAFSVEFTKASGIPGI